MSYIEVTFQLNFYISNSTIRKFFQKKNMFRRLAQKRSFIFEINKLIQFY